MTASAPKARSILYIDEYKMYSLSSQLLGGVTSSYSSRMAAEDTRSEKQQGPFGAGRTLADAVTKETETVERRVLFDYAYTVFEKEIERRGDLLVLAPDSPLPSDTARIIKITGKALFNDLHATAKFLGDYNKFGEAITYITTHGERNPAIEALETQLRDAKDNATKARLKQQLTQLQDIKSIAKTSGLQYDERFLSHLQFVLGMGYGDHFELQLHQPERLPAARFTAILDRRYLRESEASITKKYARKAQGQFTIVGVVTQIGANRDDNDKLFAARQDESTASSPRAGLLSMAMYMGNMEHQFLGVEQHELILDPIAVYQELAATTTTENA